MPKLADTVTGARVVGSRMLQASRRHDPEGRMPLMEHIRELRNRLVKAALAMVLGMVVGFVFFNPIWKFISHPFCSAVINGRNRLPGYGDRLVVTGMFDPFMLRVQIAFFVGLIISSPVWLYQIWAFIAPGLYRREKRWAYLFVGAAVPLFAAGAVLAYDAMSRGLHYLLGLTPARRQQPADDHHLPELLPGHDPGLRPGLRAAARPGLLNLAHVLTHERFRKWRRLHALRRLPVRGHRQPEPGPDQHADAGLPASCWSRWPR